MKQSVSPAVAVVIILVVIGAVAFFYFRANSVAGSAGNQPPGMPSDVAAEFEKRLGGSTGPGNTTGGTKAGAPPGAGAGAGALGGAFSTPTPTTGR